MISMPRKSKLNLPPIHEGEETVGKRIARLRKDRGLTQIELAKKIGIVRVLISDYERDRLRLHADMVIRFAIALSVSTDEILGLKSDCGEKSEKPNSKLLRRMRKIELLSPFQQKSLIQTIDTFLKGAGVE